MSTQDCFVTFFGILTCIFGLLGQRSAARTIRSLKHENDDLRARLARLEPPEDPNYIDGVVFPHPSDPRWSPEDGLYTLGPITVTPYTVMVDDNDVSPVSAEERVGAYYRAIRRAHAERRALEAMS